MSPKKSLSYAFITFVALFSFLLVYRGAEAEESESQLMHENTMLMFVGEDLTVLSIASRREEGAWKAPAVAKVIPRKEIREKSYLTLAEALSATPGFYMAQREYGSLPYLRGVPNSALFLYDTIPIASDTNKSLHLLDREMSLYSVKRIEIVRGPGSVLWGPDAFAGIVNVVPMSGKELRGVESGVIYGAPGDQKGLFANLGHDGGHWDAFLSVSGRMGSEDGRAVNTVSFWGDGFTPADPLDRLGFKEPDEARYAEASARLSLRDWITFSGRVADYRKPYSISAYKASEIWQETRGAPNSMLKLEAKKDLDHRSVIRFTGSYTAIEPQFEIIDRMLKQKETTSYGELLYDRSILSGKGLLTGGVSYREKIIKGAPIWDSYLPEFLNPENLFFVPQLQQTNYSSRLWSFFGQYAHKVGDFDLTIGLRSDQHRDYKDHISYNLGFVWFPSHRWIAKLLHGSSYRTPFSRQLINESAPDLEKMESLSAQVAWKPHKALELGVVGFSQKITKHMMEDPYAGLSEPNSQRISGIEFEGRAELFGQLELAANFTLLDNIGTDETYKYNDFTFVRPDGTLVKHYTDLYYPYDTGPKRLLNFSAAWRPLESLVVSGRLSYSSSRLLVYPRGESLSAYPRSEGVWLLDVGMVITDFFLKGLDLSVAVKNIADRRYDTPGTYDFHKGSPASIEFSLVRRW